jgi:hypothetical protein
VQGKKAKETVGENRGKHYNEFIDLFEQGAQHGYSKMQALIIDPAIAGQRREFEPRPGRWANADG